jgi:hypothetical protein
VVTDFLSRLLDRSLERVPVLQRRRPSLFELTPDYAQLGGKLSEHAKEEEMVSDLELPGIREASTFRSTAARPHHAAAALATNLAPEGEEQDSVHLAKPVAPGTRSESHSHDVGSEDTTPTVSEKRLPKTVVPPALTRVVETIVEKEVEQPQLSVRSTRLAITGSDAPAAELSFLTSSPHAVVTPAFKLNQRNEDIARRDEVRKAGTELSPVKPAKPVLQPSFPPLPRPVVPSARHQAEIMQGKALAVPTIQVTIGRIEVRAIMPPAVPTTRAVRPVAPKLSLEDYLRSRAGGGK